MMDCGGSDVTVKAGDMSEASLVWLVCLCGPIGTRVALMQYILMIAFLLPFSHVSSGFSWQDVPSWILPSTTLPPQHNNQYSNHPLLRPLARLPPPASSSVDSSSVDSSSSLPNEMVQQYCTPSSMTLSLLAYMHHPVGAMHYSSINWHHYCPLPVYLAF